MAAPRVALCDRTDALRLVAQPNHFTDFRTLAVDPGRYTVTRDKKDWKAFRTPTLREIAKTGPYMHKGIFATLEQVIEFFDQGGGKGNTALKPLKLSAEEKKTLKVFMEEALTGAGEPFRYPKLP